jgi:hypothetical protein
MACRNATLGVSAAMRMSARVCGLAGAATLAAQRLQDGRARSHEKQSIP